MGRRWLYLAVAASLVAGGAAGAAVPTPKAGCFAVRDAAGDGSFAAQLDPSMTAVSDAAVDITGMNIGVSAKTVTVYLSLQALADPGSPGGTLPATYDARLQAVGGKSLSMWQYAYGPAQPIRALVKDVGVADPEEPQYNLRYVRAVEGAAVDASGANPGTPVPVTVTRDLGHSLIAWSFDRGVLEKALGFRFDPGKLLTLGDAATRYDAADMFGVPADAMASGLVRLGTSRCV
jgi:hypothetical protein